MRNSSSLALLIGRLCMCAIFIITGVWKFVNYNGVSEEMASKGMPWVPFFLILAAIIEIIGGLSLFLGYKTRFWAAILMVYLIPVTIIFHDFWNAPEVQRYTQVIEFLKNVTIIGGLWDVIGSGPGRLSLDAFIKKKSTPQE
jgi:putative oxidoreductase